MGRAPTNGYCHTCRRRHVKCDRGRPSCTRCLRSGHICQGYEMPLRMINIGLVPNASPTAPNQPESHSECNMPCTHRTPTLNPPPQLSLIAFKDPISLGYFLSNYAWAHWWKALVIDGLRQPPTSASYMACQSLLMGFFGSGHASHTLQIRSMKLYGGSMRLVSQGLDARANTPFADLVLPVMILGMYPYVIEKSGDLEHNNGLELVIRSCGPRLNPNGNTVDAFRSCRAMLICTALANRQATFLDDPEWKTVPFLNAQKTSMDMLLDIVASLPGLVENLYKAKESGHPASVLELTARASFLREALQRWRCEWERINPRAAQFLTTGRPSTISTSPSPGSTLAQTVLRREIQFRNLDLALEILGYNAALVYLFRIQELLGYEQGSLYSPLMPEDMHYINNQLLEKECHSPLLLPHEVQFSIQPALEAVQQSAYIAAELKSTDLMHFIALAPVGIIYCALKNLGQFGDPLAEAIVGRLSAETAVDQLKVFGLW